MTNKKILPAVLCIFYLVFYTSAYAYELNTHARLTHEAYSRSVLNDAQLIMRLGLDSAINSSLDAPFGDSYYDVSGNTINTRQAEPNGILFDVKFMGLSDPKQRFSLLGWLMRGAIREDDHPGGPNPQDDPYDEPGYQLIRVLHHFFDPVNDHPLNVGGLSGMLYSAPAWALGTANSDVFTQPNTRETASRNHFTIFDAREAMWRALTGRTRDGVNATPGATNEAPAPESVRKAYWATTFRALGDVVHLVQDMAQPQHTRNDPHAGVWPTVLTGHKSIYEEYIDARAKGEATYVIDGAPRDLEPLEYLSIDGVAHEIPRFAKYSDYWSTREGNAGRGLADYSNRAFFSFGRNLGNPFYALPSNNPAEYTPEAVPLGDLPQASNESVHFLSKDGIKLTTESVFDRFLGTRKEYSLNRFNYDDMAKHLIPRAVAYSAGLIDHFFRGNMEISLPDDGVYAVVDHGQEYRKDVDGFRKIKLKLRNISPDPLGGPSIEPMGTGAAVAIVRFFRNDCYQPDLSREYGAPGVVWGDCRTQEPEVVISNVTTVSADLNQEAQPLTFDFQDPVPVNATDVQLQVVFRGPLGEEADAVVVSAFKDISEPTFIGSYERDEQYLYNLCPAGDGCLPYCPPDNSGCVTELSWRQMFCEVDQEPDLDYDFCRSLYHRKHYLRFALPTGFDSANAVATFDAAAVFDLPVSSYGRVAILGDVGPVTLYSIYEDRNGSILNNGVPHQLVEHTTVNQLYSASGVNTMMTTPYSEARGIFATNLGYQALSVGNAYQPRTAVQYPPTMSPLTPTPGTSNF